jgi:hypothetical protein
MEFYFQQLKNEWLRKKSLINLSKTKEKIAKGKKKAAH